MALAFVVGAAIANVAVVAVLQVPFGLRERLFESAQPQESFQPTFDAFGIVVLEPSKKSIFCWGGFNPPHQTTLPPHPLQKGVHTEFRRRYIQPSFRGSHSIGTHHLRRETCK